MAKIIHISPEEELNPVPSMEGLNEIKYIYNKYLKATS